MITPRPSSVCPFTTLNDVSSEIPGQNFFKLHVEPCVKRGLKYIWSRSINQDGQYIAPIDL